MGSSLDLDPLGLPQSHAFAWYSRVGELNDAALLAAYEAILSGAERQRHESFHFAEDRKLYLVAHALLRTTLSRFAAVQPQEWEFSGGEFERPEIAGAAPSDRIRFNLSHTSGLTVCVITRNAAVGIDVECLDRRVDCTSIAQHYFAPQEARDLAARSGAERDVRFLEYWTLKESFVKARGGGLSIPLDSFHLHNQDGAWRICFADGNLNPAEWQFQCLRPTANHVLSIAIHRPGQPDYLISCEESVPLVGGRNQRPEHADCRLPMTGSADRKIVEPRP